MITSPLLEKMRPEKPGISDIIADIIGAISFIGFVYFVWGIAACLP